MVLGPPFKSKIVKIWTPTSIFGRVMDGGDSDFIFGGREPFLEWLMKSLYHVDNIGHFWRARPSASSHLALAYSTDTQYIKHQRSITFPAG